MREDDGGRWAWICRVQAVLTRNDTTRALLLQMAAEYDERSAGRCATNDNPIDVLAAETEPGGS
jgi:hypothetical protein